MGTDIHPFVEVRGTDGKWRLVSHVLGPNEYEKGHKWLNDAPDWIVTRKYDTGYEVKRNACDPGRNYDLFAILANVRNGFGFAGCPTGEGFVPIHEQRGYPKDCDPLYRCGEYESGEHSRSWATVAELDAYDWDRTTTHAGMLDLQEYKAWKESGSNEPDSWCGGISGPRIQHVSTKQADEMLKARPDIKAKEKGAFEHAEIEGVIYVVSVQWTATYRDSCLYFLDEIMPKLHACGKPEDVRYLYSFDS